MRPKEYLALLIAIPTQTGFQMLRLKISPRVIIFGLPLASTDTTKPAGVG
jgi:hypothetical protein